MRKTTIRAAALYLVFLTSQAFAGTIGNASVNDVTLGGETADAFKYASGINPHGKAGSTGFAQSFAASGTGSWANIAGFETAKGKSGTDVAILPIGSLLFAFTNTNGLTGNWSVTNSNLARDVRLDLVFAMHTGGGSGAWLFDDQVIHAGEKLTGNWSQKMFNNGKQMGAFSNLTLFSRNAELMPKLPDPVDPVKVPEPGTLATLALGLGWLGATRRRKQS